jgi:hypothetical protein
MVSTLGTGGHRGSADLARLDVNRSLLHERRDVGAAVRAGQHDPSPQSQSLSGLPPLSPVLQRPPRSARRPRSRVKAPSVLPSEIVLFILRKARSPRRFRHGCQRSWPVRPLLKTTPTLTDNDYGMDAVVDRPDPALENGGSRVPGQVPPRRLDGGRPCAHGECVLRAQGDRYSRWRW